MQTCNFIALKPGTQKGGVQVYFCTKVNSRLKLNNAMPTG